MRDILLLRWKADQHEAAAAESDMRALTQSHAALLQEQTPQDPLWPEIVKRATGCAQQLGSRVIAHSGYELGSTLSEIAERLIHANALGVEIILTSERLGGHYGGLGFVHADLANITKLDSSARSGRAANSHARNQQAGLENKRLRVPPETRAAILAALDAGELSLRSIAAKFGVSRPTIERIKAEASEGAKPSASLAPPPEEVLRGLEAEAHYGTYHEPFTDGRELPAKAPEQAFLYRGD